MLLYLTKKLRDSVIHWLRDFIFFLSNTFVYEPILLKLSMNANIVEMQIFHKTKYDLRGCSSSQIMTFLIKKIPLFFCLCYWLIEETNPAEHYERTKFDLYKDDICLVLTLTYVLKDNFLSLFFMRCTFSQSFSWIDVWFHSRKNCANFIFSINV